MAMKLTTADLPKGVTLDLPKGITIEQLQAHEMSPPHVEGIETEEMDLAREKSYEFPLAEERFKGVPELDPGAFGLAIHNVLKDIVIGYILRVRQNGTLAHAGIWHWAQTPADVPVGWNKDTRMHVASVSKFLTAVGLVKILNGKNISYDAKIAGYLPTYWKKGPGIDQVTFRHLLTHKSGFSTGGSASDYGLMKRKVAAGVSTMGTYDYENMNFGLCRILIPIINGNISKAATFGVPPGVRFGLILDKAWDVTTIRNYLNFMRGRVFSPAGVKNNPGFAPGPGPRALAYPVPPTNKDGWNSGDLATVSGGAGWRLSVKEVLDVMDHVRRRNTIISKETAQYMLDNYFGIDQATDTAAGKIYNKNGFWKKSDGRTEQCVAYFFPNNMEAVVFANSSIGAENLSLRNLVRDAFKNSLK